MDIFSYFFIFFLGASIGSFLGVIIDRLPRGESIVKGRSYCEFCKKTLGFWDLIPLFSFLFLGGKCRYCHKRLSPYYWIVELVSGIVFVLMFVSFVQTQQIFNFITILELCYVLFIGSILVGIFFIDLKYGIIPFSFVFPATFLTVFYIIWRMPESVLSHLLAAGGAFLFFFALFFFTKGKGMGFGDVVYVIFMGFLLGFPNIIVGLYIAFISGAIVSLLLVWLRRKKIKGGIIPFGPFLVAGTFISLLWGDMIVAKIVRYLLLS